MGQAPAPQNHQKTIMVVDDNPMILAFVSGLLVDSYNVLSAGSGADAMRQANEYEQESHLLLSDFEMPEMSGIELASAMMIRRPLLKVLLMSGFFRFYWGNAGAQ